MPDEWEWNENDDEKRTYKNNKDINDLQNEDE